MEIDATAPDQPEQANDVAGPSPAQGSGKEREAHGLVLPFARIKKMMKENADVKTISAEANFVVARAAELFLQDFAQRAHAAMLQDEQRKGNVLDYKDLATVVHSWEAVEFLHDVVPQKVSAAEVLAQLQQQQDQQQEEQQQPDSQQQQEAEEQ